MLVMMEVFFLIGACCLPDVVLDGLGREGDDFFPSALVLDGEPEDCSDIGAGKDVAAMEAVFCVDDSGLSCSVTELESPEDELR